MVAMVSWPTVTDDDGTLTVGTPWSNAISVALKASIEDQVHSATNPTVKPYEATDELILARGSLASMSAWTLVEHLADGTHVASSTYVTATQAGDAGIFKNLDTDSLLNNWPDGDAAAPAGRVLSGAGAVIARCGTGLGDTTSLAWGDWCAQVTYGSAAALLTKTLLAAADYQQGYDGKEITIACRCKSSVANQASIVFDDGAVQTRGGSTGNTAPLYHTGDGNEGWIWTTATIDTAATKLEYYVESAQAGSQPYFGCFMVVLGEVVPTVHQSERMGELYMGGQVRGDLTVGDLQNDWYAKVPRDCIFMGMAGAVKTAPDSTTVVTSSSVANPSNILCAAAHGLTSGDSVTIAGHITAVPDINGVHVATVVDTTNFTIPINVTTGGTGGTVNRVLAVTFTVEKSTDLSAWADVYTTAPDIDDVDKEIDDDVRTIPDGTYANKCLKAGDYLRFNIDLIGAGLIPAAELSFDFMFSVPMPELDVHKV